MESVPTEGRRGLLWSVRYSCSIRSTNCDTPSRWPSLACCSTVRQSSANAAAPSVEPFDFSVCAARRSSSVSCCLSELRRLVISRGASAKKDVHHLGEEVDAAEVSQVLERGSVETHSHSLRNRRVLSGVAGLLPQFAASSSRRIGFAR